MATQTPTARAFDPLAPRYDDIVETNPLHQVMRQRSLAWLDEAFAPGMRVLEVGCGTGTEAIHLARRGVDVVATDASPRMIEETRARLRKAGLQRHVDTLTAPALELPRRFDRESFDGAYASFGVLNCAGALETVLSGIAALLKPRASFITSIVSRPCMGEIFVAGATLQFRKAFRRMRGPMAMDLYGLGEVYSRAYSEAEIRAAMAPVFDIVRIEGWLITLPPPYAARAWSRVRVLHAPAQRLDARLGRLWPFRGWGDHLHVWARRRIA